MLGQTKNQLSFACAGFGTCGCGKWQNSYELNLFGGIMDSDVIAKEVVTAVKETGPKLPLVVCLKGNYVTAGKQTLASSCLPIISGDTMADAAQKVVNASAK